MKKTVKFLVFLLAFFFVGLTGVTAKTIDSDNIPEDTYVIGTHLFNRDTNSDYNGSLTTKAVMLAAKTISSDSLNKMIIYYKNIDGEWIDGLTSQPIEVPHYFEINYINTRVNLATPYAYGYTYGGLGDYTSTNPPKPYELWADIVAENIAITGMEIYYSETIDGNYKLLENVTNQEIYDEGYIYAISTLVEIEKGKTFYYKVRFFKSYGEEKVYSEFSEPVECENDAIELDTIVMGHDAYDNLYSRLTIDAYGDADGIEIEYKADDDATYQVVRRVTADALANEDTDEMAFYTVAGMDEDYYRVRPYKNTSSGIIYGSYSNEVLMANWIPQIELNASLSEKYYNDEETLMYYYSLEVDVAGQASGIELYMSTTEDGEYTYVDSKTSNFAGVEIPAGETRYYKARIYYESSEGKVVGKYSNVVECKTELSVPVLDIYEDWDYDEDTYENVIYDVLEVEDKGIADSIEVYYSTEEDGNYKLIKSVDASQESIRILQNETTSNYYKVKAVDSVSNQTSDFSNIVSSNDMNSNLYFDVDYVGYTKDDGSYSYRFDVEPEQLVGVSGFEVYLSDEYEEEPYELVATSTDKTAKIFVEPGSYSVVIRKFKTLEDGTKYSEYSDSQYIDTYDKDFKIEAIYSSTNSNGSLYDLSMDNLPLHIENLEMLVSDTEDGEFVSIQLPEVSGYYADGRPIYAIEIPKGTTKYYKVKISHGMGEGSVYISNILKLTSEITTPHLNNLEVVGTTSESIYLDLGVKTSEVVSGQILYTSDQVDGEYIEIARREYLGGFSTADPFKVKQKNIKKYFKIKTYVEYGDEIVYSNYSVATDEIIVPTPNIIYYTEEYMDNYNSYYINVYDYRDGISIGLYSSNAEDGEYNLVTESDSDIEFITKVFAGETCYYKSRAKVVINGIEYYSDFSESLTLEGASIVEPTLLNSSENEEKKYTSYEDGYYIYDLAIDFEKYKLDDGTYYVDGYDIFLLDRDIYHPLISSGKMGETAVVKVPEGSFQTVYAKAYVEYNGEKIYSYESNYIYLSGVMLDTPTLTYEWLGTYDGATPEMFDLKISPVYHGVEVYYSTDENGEYKLLKTESTTQSDSVSIEVPLEKKYYIKIRTYFSGDYYGEIAYSKYSNTIELEPSKFIAESNS